MANESQGPVTPEKAREFNRIATEVFGPIYPVIAGQILERLGIRQGRALDLGSGPAHLGIALARVSSLKVWTLDVAPANLPLAQANITAAGLRSQVRPVGGDVHALPFRDAVFDLIVSRGSLFFWQDRALGLREAYRVLAPGGATYLGGGFGNSALKARIFDQMAKWDPNFQEGVKGRLNPENRARILESVHAAGIPHFDIIQDDSGFWIVLRRPRA